MLAIPLLRADIQLNTDAFSSFLKSQKSASDASIVSEIQTFTEARSAALSVTTDGLNGALEQQQQQQILYRYAAHLQSMAPRLASFESESKFSFSWSDAFNAGRKYSSGSLYFELACIAFNLGALESIAGAKTDRAQEEGIRTASKHFQEAAGFFECVKDRFVPLVKMAAGSGTNPCLSIDSLTMMRDLMLAQAQLCFYEKAVRDKKAGSMKASIIAKIAAQTSTFYGKAANICKNKLIIDTSWFFITDFQSKCLFGAAEYWQAAASKEIASQRATGYGEEVARLARAGAQVEAAMTLSRNQTLSPPLVAGAEALQHAIASTKKKAEYDLQTVYLETVPPDSSLPQVSGVVMVKASLVLIPLPSSLNPPENILFRDVLPKGVLESRTKFIEEMHLLSQETKTMAENASNLARVTLSSVGLPGSLEASTTSNDNPLPPNLYGKVKRVQEMGGKNRLSSMLQDLRALSSRAVGSMATIEESLDREVRADEAFRARYPPTLGAQAYTVPASSLLNLEIRAAVTSIRNAYSAAQEGDKKIAQDLELSDQNTGEISEAFAILGKSKQELSAMFSVNGEEAPKTVNLLDFDEKLDASAEGAPTTSGKDADVLGAAGQQLEIKLEELAQILEARTTLADTLSHSVGTTDYSALVLSALTSSSSHAKGISSETAPAAVEGVFQVERGKFVGMKDTIAGGIATQERLLSEILALNQSFQQDRAQNPASLARNNVITKIEQSVARYFTFFSQLSAGTNFYSDMQSKLSTLQQRADDLALTQQWQRQEFESNLNHQITRSAQEEQDRAMAEKLAEEMRASAPPPPFTPSPSHVAPAAPTGPASAQAPQGMVYGVPVCGPPANSTIIATHGSSGSGHAAANSVQNQYYHQAAGLAPSPYQQQQQQQPQQYNAYIQPAPSPSPYASPPLLPTPQQQPPQQPIYQNHPNQQHPHPQSPQNSTPHQPPVYTATGQPFVSPSPSYAGNIMPENGAYNPATMPNYSQQYPNQQQPQQQQPQQQQMQAPPRPQLTPQEFELKVLRLCEMGFPRDQVSAAMQANEGDEEAALNSLLSSSSSSQPPAGAAAGGSTNPAATNTAQNSSSMGGFFKKWGK